MSYKFLIDNFEVYAVEVNGVVLRKSKSLGTPFWDLIWNLQYIIDKCKKEFIGRSEVSADEYKKIFSFFKHSENKDVQVLP